MKSEAFEAKTLRLFHSLNGKTGAEVQTGQGPGLGWRALDQKSVSFLLLYTPTPDGKEPTAKFKA